MSKETTVIVLGLWILVLPLLGIPRSWLTVLMIVTAALLIVVGFFLRAEVLSRTARRAGHNHPFAEHLPHEAHEDNHLGHERKEKLNSLNYA
jgi:ABC-type nickel/cobalt efflux system permease component RcnA